MLLSENLKKNNIILKTKSKTRWELVKEMLDLAIKNKEVDGEDRETLIKSLIDREKSMSTGIGKNVAIPHCTTAMVEEIVLILATCEDGIDFESIDSQPVNIIVLLLVPKKKLKQHIKTLANVARIMNDDELKEKLFTLKSPEALVKTVKEYEKNYKK